jgi:SAM-dependent methyltransferase
MTQYSATPTSVVPPVVLPSRTLVYSDGLWRPPAVGTVSYPAEGNEACFQVEDRSYWFQHRNACIVAAVRRHASEGPIYDIGGGNGYVSLALQAAGHAVVLVEPGPGAANGLRRGVTTVVQSTLADAAFEPASIDAVGVFDVVEHVEHDVAFLAMLRDVLKPGGLVFCTVPALPCLWSDEDAHAGHYRRYTARSLGAAMRAAGLRVEFMSFFFSWLIVPVLAFRTAPSLLRRPRLPAHGSQSIKADHSLPPSLTSFVQRTHAWELARITSGRRIPFGTSLICVARRP